MCNLFIRADEDLWKSSTRSVRVDGVVTSVRLEAFFWQTLEEIADRDDLSVGQLITRLFLEAMDAEHDLGNFASFLRVCCSRYLSLVADGQLERDVHEPLADLDTDPVFKAEEEAANRRRQTIAIRRSDVSQSLN